MTDSTRGQIPLPELDDRTWADLVEEAQQRIRARVPSWTDTSPNDLGVALVELFAWLVEGLTFRLNQVPDKNYVAFLNLLGIKRQPPREARTRLVLAVADAPAVFATEPDPTRAEARGDDGAPPIVFELEEPVVALPWVAAIRASGQAPTAFDVIPLPKSQAGASLPAISFTYRPPANPPQTGLAAGEYLWLCAAAKKLQGDSVAIWLPEVRVPTDGMVVEWLRLDQGNWKPATVSADNTQGLTQTGVVALATAGWQAQPLPTTWLPGDLAGQTAPNKDSYYWFALRLHASATAAANFVGKPVLLLNSGEASTTVTVVNEALGVSDGSTLQTFALAHWPVFLGDEADPYAQLSVTVTPPGGQPTSWSVTDEFGARTATAANVCRLSAATGELSFGYITAADATGATQDSVGGNIPLAGSTISFDRYRYVSAGASGNIAAFAVSTLLTPGSTASVGNPFAADGGIDEEAIDDAKARAPALLRSRDRAVTSEDYERLASDAASSEVQAARCLTPLLWTGSTRGRITPNAPANFAGLNRGSGHVTLVVVPSTKGTPDPMPSPSPELLTRVRSYIGQRQPAGATLDMRPPFYLPITVVLKINIWPDQTRTRALPKSSEADYEKSLSDVITAYLHPTQGGPAGAGFTVGQSLHVQDIFEAIAIPKELGYVSNIKVYAISPPPYYSSLPSSVAAPERRPVDLPVLTTTNLDFNSPPQTLGDGAIVQATDYELICSATQHYVKVDGWPTQ